MRVPGMVLLLLTIGLAGCAGASQSFAPAPAAGVGGSSMPGTASVVIHVPKKVAVPRNVRGSRYVSPSTQSATISISPDAGCTGCTHATSADVALAQSSSSCTSSATGITCTMQFVLNPGTYTGSISTYDGAPGCQNSKTCSTLSVNQSFPWTIARGKTNQLAVTLYGVPVKTTLLPITTNAYVLGTGVFVGGVSATAKFSLYGVDADGSLIVGPGTPTFVLSSQPANGWAASLHGNVLQLTTGAAYATTKFTQFSVTLESPACAVSGTICTLTLSPFVRPLLAFTNPTANAVEILYTNRVTGTLPTYAVVTNGVSQPTDAKFDGAGRLYVANQGAGTITIYDPPYTGAPVTTIALVSSATRFAVSSGGNVAVAESFFGNSSFSVYDAPAYALATTVPIASPHIVSVMNFAFNGSLWVATNDGAVGQYASGSTTPVPQLPLGRPTGLDTDKAGNLYVADISAQTLTKYASPAYGVAATTTTTVQNPESVINLNGSPAVCGLGGGEIYTTTLALGEFTQISGNVECLVTADFLPGEYWVEAPEGTTQTQIYGPGTSALLPFAANSIAAFPRPDANY
jgi:hypothetical protein